MRNKTLNHIAGTGSQKEAFFLSNLFLNYHLSAKIGPRFHALANTRPPLS